MSRYQKYPAYRDSGVEWIGEIPAHWEVTKIRFYYDVQLGKMLQPESKTESDSEIKYLKAQHVQWNQINHDDLPTMWATEREIEKFSVQQGDLLICEGGEVGRAALLIDTMDVCIIQNALHRVRAKEKTCVKYLQYFMQHVSNALWFDILCNKATIAHLTGEKLAALEFPLPTLAEQQAIASFLDRKTAEIDELITKKETLLKKLDEKRTALITRAVIKGLDPSAPMKNSGVAWLGEIPKHWEVKQTRNIFKIYSGSTPRNGEELFWDGDIVWFTPEDLGNNQQKNISESRRKITEEGYKSCGTSLAKSNSVVLSTRAPIGHFALSTVPACCNQGCRILEPENGIPEYWYYTLLSAKPILQCLGQGSTFMELPRQSLAGFKLPVPPLEEQQAIAVQIEKKTATIDRQKAQVTEAIERLKEYRSALITDAVTGKMDVQLHQPREILSA